MFHLKHQCNQVIQRKKKKWVLEYEQEQNNLIEPLMGYTTSNNTLQQIKLFFSSLEQAINYVKKYNIDYKICDINNNLNNKNKFDKKSYEDNFKFNRLFAWTH